MYLNSEQQLILNRLDRSLNEWYEKNNNTAQIQINFQRQNPEFLYWVETTLVSSVLDGELAYDQCINDIANERDEVLRHTKYLASYALWNGLDAPANDVAKDLKDQGYNKDLLITYMTNLMRLNTENENIVSYH